MSIQAMQDFLALTGDEDGSFVHQLHGIAPYATGTFAIQLSDLLGTIRSIRQAVSYDLPPIEVTLEMAKVARKELITRWRDDAQAAGVPTAKGVMDSDPASLLKLTGSVQMAMLAIQNDEPFAIGWTMQDNVTVEHNADELIAAGQLVGQHIVACHAISVALKAAVDAAETIEDVEAISWPAPAPTEEPAPEEGA